jgi:perosamine synthetase
MTDIAAAIGIEQLKKLPDFNNKRLENAKYFNDFLDKVETPFVLENVDHVYHQYTIKCEDRVKIIENFKKNNIGFGIYYPKPLHFYKHLKQFGHNDLKNSENLSNIVLSLPIHPSLIINDLEKIVNVVNEVYRLL